MSTLRKEQMQHTLLVIAKALPISQKLLSLIVAAIGSLSEKDMQEAPRVLGRPATRWKLYALRVSRERGLTERIQMDAKVPVESARNGF